MDAFVAVTAAARPTSSRRCSPSAWVSSKVIAEVENLNYINLAESIGIDTIINRSW